jgi:hypothetical protein
VPGHESNADRIARAAAEAAAATKELAGKRAARLKAVRKPRTPPPPPRVKVVWAVGRTGSPPVKTFPYSERAAADAEAARVGKGAVVNPLKVPME